MKLTLQEVRKQENVQKRNDTQKTNDTKKKSKTKEKQNISHFESNGFLKTVSRIKPSHSKRWHAFPFKISSRTRLVRNQ